MTDLLQVNDLRKYFPVRSGLLGRVTRWVRAVDGVSFTIGAGETLGLVGESGCGKTTVGRSILRLTEPTGGEILFREQVRLDRLTKGQLRQYRPELQIIFQDPYSSLNPRRIVLDLVGEGLSEHRRVKNSQETKERVVDLLEQVGLPSGILYRYPHEFSGGQRQRLAIARALSLDPELIVCDEAVSALDVSIQAQIINLLRELRERLGIAYLFIAHDLAVVKHISHRIAVMYLGQVMEIAPTAELFRQAFHPYTLALLSAIPVADPDYRRPPLQLAGEVKASDLSTGGCRFAPRCPSRLEVCLKEEPPFCAKGPGHYVKCFLAQ
ncbi:peptide/nickel transport system ATP-binding protein/oligopeptide transport system ATP-binding protein [Hydrogenispora ethanolica]|uniref:Peptide/nickel transport system ATP-binding protein/oligopeptide transport system ATP-binding protein n=1 Tax=Hydrogenispora ethanolica TaxID=1082276 RepID=A0A4R1QXV5_HYDET|nr:ABC transporter ATP-binding protein [Hydrogenispora ethanolica]TCL57104.1 peptide/nickel transport system ATP-binding protein/oligopeptide transport system ATP-binding protein [Hydrogenispora ethanolica]